MENNKNITQNVFPEIRLFDPMARLAKLGHFVFDHIRCEGLSEHNRGAAVELDHALYDGPEE